MALFLGTLACNGESAAGNDDTTGGTTAPEPTTSTATGSESSEGTDEVCHPGYETCPCFEGGLCLAGLQCLSGLCVESPPSASSSGDESTSAATSVDEDTSTGEPVDPSTSSESEGGESSTTESEPVCFDGDTFCAADTTTMLTCIDGQWAEQSCEENCLTTGHTGTSCAANQQECICDGFSDADCALDVEVLCYCYFEDFLGDPCTDDQREEYYQWCYQDTDPVVACFGSYYDEGVSLDCQGAIDNCL